MANNKNKRKKVKGKRITSIDLSPQFTTKYFLKRIEEAEVEKYVGVVNKNLFDLSEYLGRYITDEERRAVINIVDKYSVRDRKGEIIEYLPFDYAWQIYKYRKLRKINKKIYG